jgi:hypothetical protein
LKSWLCILLLVALAHGQVVRKGKSVFKGNGVLARYAQSAFFATGENAYCTKGTGTDQTKGMPTWGASDGVALFLNVDPLTLGPGGCMYTGSDATPSPGSTVAVSYTGTTGGPCPGSGCNSTDTTALQNALNAYTCGETITIPAGSQYLAPTNGSFTFPNSGCDGAHWMTFRTTGTSNSNFPAEHTQGTPCIAGVSNDGTHGYTLPGYPSYTCPSYPTVLSAKIIANTTNQPAIQFSSGTSATISGHVRFIGIEVTKIPEIQQGPLIALFPCSYPGQVTGCTQPQGAQFVIFDRVYIHGQPWTLAADANGPTQAGITANNSQYVALINSWDIDTWCSTPGPCTDSQTYNAGLGSIQDGPHKLYGNVLESAGETTILGGGGVGPGTPVTVGFEFRANVSAKPLGWMIPIETCNLYANTIPKNLLEFKNGAYVFVEGNVFQNNWTGCQSDEFGEAIDIDPKSQNDKTAVLVDFDGTDGLVTDVDSPVCDGNPAHPCFTNNCGGNSGGVLWCNPEGGSANSQSAAASAGAVPSNCPPQGCKLQINQSGRSDNTVQYCFCNGSNGCYQTSDGTSGGTPLDQLTHARIEVCTTTTLPPAGTSVGAYSCVPGLCPTCQVHDFIARYNVFKNINGDGINVSTAIASHCNDESSGAYNIELHDLNMEALSTEMTNGPSPYEYVQGFYQSNGQYAHIINTMEIAHNTIAIDQGYNCANGGTGCQNGLIGGFGYQWDNTGVGYVFALNIHDNVAAEAWRVLHSSGSAMSLTAGYPATLGGTGRSGLEYYYPSTSCQQYYPTDAGGDVLDGNILNNVAAGTTFTFSPVLSNYYVTYNGQNAPFTGASCGGGSCSLSITGALTAGGSLTVRDLNTCSWNFNGNIMGSNDSGFTYFFGAGTTQAPYPNNGVWPNGNVVLNGNAFTSIFSNWQTRGTANYTITNATYQGAATDAAARLASGQSADPGTGQSLLGTLSSAASAIASNIFYYPITYSGSTISVLSSETSPLNPYQASLMNLLPAYGVTGGGASPYKSWWLSSVSSSAGGVILGRDGTLDGPFYVLTASRAVQSCGSAGTVACSTLNIKMANDPLTVPVVGQQITMSYFVNGTGTEANDATFNGTCTIRVINTNGSVSCDQTGTGADTIASHAPSSTACTNPGGWPSFPPFNCSALTFIPLTAGTGDTYTFSVNSKDGNFQTAAESVTVTVN